MICNCGQSKMQTNKADLPKEQAISLAGQSFASK